MIYKIVKVVSCAAAALPLVASTDVNAQSSFLYRLFADQQVEKCAELAQGAVGFESDTSGFSRIDIWKKISSDKWKDEDSVIVVQYRFEVEGNLRAVIDSGYIGSYTYRREIKDIDRLHNFSIDGNSIFDGYIHSLFDVNRNDSSRCLKGFRYYQDEKSSSCERVYRTTMRAQCLYIAEDSQEPTNIDLFALK